MLVANQVRVKICGLMRNQDALIADRSGADYLGLILSPGFRRSVALEDCAAIIESTEAPKVAVVVDEDPDGAESAAYRVDASVIQLHGNEPPNVVEELRHRGPWKLWKAVRARSLEDVTVAVGLYGPLVDGILVEGWREGVIGGGGARVTLEPLALRSLIPRSCDFVLAGGLGPDTVAEAVGIFSPPVVDVSSGVERRLGEKDPESMSAFIHQARLKTGQTKKDLAL